MVKREVDLKTKQRMCLQKLAIARIRLKEDNVRLIFQDKMMRHNEIQSATLKRSRGRVNE